MDRVLGLVATVAGLLLLAGCKTPGLLPQDGALNESMPGLLVGPEAISQAAPPAELSSKDSAKLCLRTAHEFDKQGQIEAAIRLYEKARASEPSTEKVASRRLAVLYDRAGDFSKASIEYDALLKANPKDADLLNDLGYSYYCRGDWANAEAHLTKAVQLDSNHKRAWVNLGLALAQQSKWDESYQAFCKAVRPADAHCNIAFILGAQGRIEEAKAQYREALKLDPGMQLAQAGLAHLENPKPIAEERAKSNVKRTPEEAAALVPNIAEIEERLIKEGKLKPREATRKSQPTPAQPSPSPVAPDAP